jgi:hypothetical protein
VKIERPKLPRVSEQMKAWSAALADEVLTWPYVSSKSFFGFTAVSRKRTMFALLPRTRGMESANSLAVKFENPTASLRTRLLKDSRIGKAHLATGRWFTFEISSDRDLNEALRWLQRAYQAAGNKKKTK